jgi:deoxyribonuclease-4
MLLGVHCSVAGGVNNAFNEVHEHGLDTFQIFTKNQRQWKEKIIEDEEGKSFTSQLKKDKIKYAFSHCTYLINLASNDPTLRENSILSLAGEVSRCEALGLSYCVLHPGASKGADENHAIKLIADGLNLVIKNTKDMGVKILLENTAGQGTSIGWKFEHLKDIIDQIKTPSRIGVCFDTCHAFAAGYDIRTKTGFEDTMSQLDKLVGIEKLYTFHLNDSKGDVGSRIDRHDNIGKGKIGLEPFRIIMNKFPHIPKVIETPKEMDKENLKTLRSLIK